MSDFQTEGDTELLEKLQRNFAGRQYARPYKRTIKGIVVKAMMFRLARTWAKYYTKQYRHRKTNAAMFCEPAYCNKICLKLRFIVTV
ncbi:hypothetical protein D7V94_10035 [Parablautia intestinalis]|uniref:Uncharacterized protein n=1 Tax=Parablautia intestinalis TaxID=2320100 RepID=A0A3A9AVN5_9FIRM|nr:hypothetical protein [Parablautia intestinalis]RKI91593.1 hypothetical protein D7V94_10035 [Parablautia intestinalis]